MNQQSIFRAQVSSGASTLASAWSARSLPPPTSDSVTEEYAKRKRKFGHEIERQKGYSNWQSDESALAQAASKKERQTNDGCNALCPRADGHFTTLPQEMAKLFWLAHLSMSCQSTKIQTCKTRAPALNVRLEDASSGFHGHMVPYGLASKAHSTAPCDHGKP
jgi:hypothetical protein